MKNTINYYYNLNPNKINQIFGFYYFYVNNELYYFTIYNRDLKDLQAIFEFNREMVKHNIIVNEIINNKQNNIITYLGKTPYLLTKVSLNINKQISLSEINYLSSINLPYKTNLMRQNWLNLWTNKIDYLEYHHEQNYQKYPLLSNSFNYFIGLSENAISYLNRAIKTIYPEKSDIGVISHEHLTTSDTIYALYDPQNIIIDHKARDVAEYIKLSFFKDNYSIFDELNTYFHYNYFSRYGVHLLLSRVLYPSFYFEIYDEVINNKLNESNLLKYTSRISEYEKYLQDIFEYFKRYYDINEINWLKKRGTNPH